jgi:hypothetical protein
LASGTYYYRVIAYDVAGNASTPSNQASGIALGDTVPPAVSITAPANGATVNGTIAITATATDSGGVAGVQFRANGSNIGGEDTSAPYSVSWNTSTVPNGSYALTAVARDAAGNTTESQPVTVTVSNSTQTPSGLVAAYGFNEGAGSQALDATGAGHVGSITAATWTTAGQTGGALTFNGTSARVTVADAPDLDFTTGMTLEAWVRPTALSGWRTVILKERANGLAYSLYAHDGAPRPAATVNLGGSDLSTPGSTALPLNTWTHLATTFDGTTLRLFVNGIQVGAVPFTGSIIPTTGVLTIGGNSIWGEYFAGQIDEVRIYNRALTAGEIQTDMATPVGGGS